MPNKSKVPEDYDKQLKGISLRQLLPSERKRKWEFACDAEDGQKRSIKYEAKDGNIKNDLWKVRIDSKCRVIELENQLKNSTRVITDL